MNAMQLDALERVAVDQLAAEFGGSHSAMSSAADTATVGMLVEMGLVSEDTDPHGGPGIRVTRAGVEALAYLVSAA